MANLGWGAFSNGLIPAGSLVSTNGGLFQADAGRNFARMATDFRAATGYTLTITEAYRPYAEQVRLFKARYTAGWGSGISWGGQFWRKKAGAAVAAVPGTSNHGWGRAVDLGGYGDASTSRWRWLIDHAGAYGFSWATGRASGELWHWEYVGGINTAAGGTGTPISPGEDDDMYSEQDRQRDNAAAERSRQIEAALTGKINGEPVGLNADVNFGQPVMYGLQEARKALQTLLDQKQDNLVAALVAALAPHLATGGDPAALTKMVGAEVDRVLKDDFAKITAAIPTEFTISASNKAG